jgi:hypothetical protein
VLQSLSKEDGVSSAKGTMLLVVHEIRLVIEPIPWLPRFLDLTPRNFNLRGYVKDRIYQPLMPQSLYKQISQAIANLDESKLQCAWEIFEYHVKFCRVINGAYIKHL